MFGLASRLGCSLKGPVTKENSTLRLRNISSPYSTSSSDGKKRESEPPARESFKQHSKTADEVEKLEALLKAAKDPRNAESPVDADLLARSIGVWSNYNQETRDLWTKVYKTRAGASPFDSAQLMTDREDGNIPLQHSTPNFKNYLIINKVTAELQSWWHDPFMLAALESAYDETKKRQRPPITDPNDHRALRQQIPKRIDLFEEQYKKELSEFFEPFDHPNQISALNELEGQESLTAEDRAEDALFNELSWQDEQEQIRQHMGKSTTQPELTEEQLEKLAEQVDADTENPFWTDFEEDAEGEELIAKPDPQHQEQIAEAEAAVEKDLLKKKKKEEAAQEDSILTEEMRVLLSNEDKAILFDPEPGDELRDADGKVLSFAERINVRKGDNIMAKIRKVGYSGENPSTVTLEPGAPTHVDIPQTPEEKFASDWEDYRYKQEDIEAEVFDARRWQLDANAISTASEPQMEQLEEQVYNAVFDELRHEHHEAEMQAELSATYMRDLGGELLDRLRRKAFDAGDPVDPLHIFEEQKNDLEDKMTPIYAAKLLKEEINMKVKAIKEHDIDAELGPLFKRKLQKLSTEKPTFPKLGFHEVRTREEKRAHTEADLTLWGTSRDILEHALPVIPDAEPELRFDFTAKEGTGPNNVHYVDVRSDPRETGELHDEAAAEKVKKEAEAREAAGLPRLTSENSLSRWGAEAYYYELMKRHENKPSLDPLSPDVVKSVDLEIRYLEDMLFRARQLTRGQIPQPSTAPLNVQFPVKSLDPNEPQPTSALEQVVVTLPLPPPPAPDDVVAGAAAAAASSETKKDESAPKQSTAEGDKAKKATDEKAKEKPKEEAKKGSSSSSSSSSTGEKKAAGTEEGKKDEKSSTPGGDKSKALEGDVFDTPPKEISNEDLQAHYEKVADARRLLIQSMSMNPQLWRNPDYETRLAVLIDQLQNLQRKYEMLLTVKRSAVPEIDEDEEEKLEKEQWKVLLERNAESTEQREEWKFLNAMNFSADSPLSEKAKVFPQFKQNPKEDIRSAVLRKAKERTREQIMSDPALALDPALIEKLFLEDLSTDRAEKEADAERESWQAWIDEQEDMDPLLKQIYDDKPASERSWRPEEYHLNKAMSDFDDFTTRIVENELIIETTLTEIDDSELITSYPQVECESFEQLVQAARDIGAIDAKRKQLVDKYWLYGQYDDWIAERLKFEHPEIEPEMIEAGLEMKRIEKYILPTKPARIAAKILGVAIAPYPLDFPQQTFLPPYEQDPDKYSMTNGSPWHYGAHWYERGFVGRISRFWRRRAYPPPENWFFGEGIPHWLDSQQLTLWLSDGWMWRDLKFRVMNFVPAWVLGWQKPVDQSQQSEFREKAAAQARLARMTAKEAKLDSKGNIIKPGPLYTSTGTAPMDLEEARKILGFTDSELAGNWFTAEDVKGKAEAIRLGNTAPQPSEGWRGWLRAKLGDPEQLAWEEKRKEAEAKGETIQPEGAEQGSLFLVAKVTAAEKFLLRWLSESASDVEKAKAASMAAAGKKPTDAAAAAGAEGEKKAAEGAEKPKEEEQKTKGDEDEDEEAEGGEKKDKKAEEKKKPDEKK